jgi:lupus La protein
MIKFNRLSSLTTDTQVIADAVRQSKSEMIEVNDANDKVRRNPKQAMPENSLEYWQKVKHRTVYVVRCVKFVFIGRLFVERICTRC